MSHVSLYRKYRSQRFDDLVGQPHVVRTLQNALKSGRYSHAYLFIGPRGTGKTSTARMLAKALCCEKGPAEEPCNECDICVSITAGNCMDVIEMDAASESGVDDVREAILHMIEYRPAQASFKVFIIDEVHDLSPKAFDALLKTIEEPPAHLVFVLATTEYAKVPPTIRSRCQKFEFRRGSLAEIVSRLQHVAKSEGIESDPAALGAIARMSDGSYRDALNLLELAALTAEGKVTLDHVYDQLGLVHEEQVDALLTAIRESDVAKVVQTIEDVYRQGRDARAILESLMYRLSDLTVSAWGLSSTSASDAAVVASQKALAMQLGRDAILSMRSSIGEALVKVRMVSLPRLWLESELIRLASEVPWDGAKTRPQPEARAARPQAEKAPQAVEERPRKSEPSPTKAVVAGGEEASAEAPPDGVSRMEEPQPDDPPEIARAKEVWKAAVEHIQAQFSKVMAQKLLSTRVVGFESGTLSIEFDRKIDCDSMTSGPNGPARITKVKEIVGKFAGEEWEVDFAAANRKAKSSSAEAVELPAEGESLLDLSRQVFPNS
ncbi:MAG: DNA polymerase III subunit gamma/tau [Fimbriimonadaceae bacterium]|nr:DNA polymerase III subunit gamma/tau [Fimbriimonadaceae bacterium]